MCSSDKRDLFFLHGLQDSGRAGKGMRQLWVCPRVVITQELEYSIYVPGYSIIIHH
jgi:hypothetical protein